ncbi:ArsR family transcriptional regulator [Murinocardiopsis flavida]|uniref:ArsR family transcriptional regulator n=1 Tax=Murinocardiopsis flavida TaxID=645275 RepID=A0A2P8CVE2_9ACTN|nr:ArsR family transcriptional regulator [Murinocardiopsis flavida]PSK88916.1 ArsR family transcriptional regulator [Murinocardiopsis flavida]
MEFAEKPIYAQLARIGKELSSPIRLRLLDLLDARERTVEQLAAESGVPLKNTSAQLQRLHAAHLVTARKEGTRVYYRLADDRVAQFLDAFQGFAEERLADLRDTVAAHLGDPAELRPVAAAELAERLADPGVLVVDVRSPEEYAAGHVPGAVSVPMAELRAGTADLPWDVRIVAYCQGPYCVVSPQAVRILRARGHDARPLDGGFTRWTRSRHATGPAGRA